MCVYLNNRKTLIQKDSYSPVFIAALFIITKVSKQPKDLLMDKWIKKTWDTHTHTHIHTHTGILVSHGKNEILLFVTTGMDLEGLSEHKSDGEKQILYDFIHMWNKKKAETNWQNKNKVRGEGGWGAGEMGEEVSRMVVDGETRGDQFRVHKCSITMIYTWNNIITIIIIEAAHRLWVKVRRLAKSQGTTDYCDEHCRSCIHC